MESNRVNVSAAKMSIFFLVFLQSVCSEHCQNHDVYQLVDKDLHFNHDLFIFYAEIKHYVEIVSSHYGCVLHPEFAGRGCSSLKPEWKWDTVTAEIIGKF